MNEPKHRFNFIGLVLVVIALATCNALSSAKKPKQALCFELYQQGRLITKYKIQEKVDKNLYFAREIYIIDTQPCVKIVIHE